MRPTINYIAIIASYLQQHYLSMFSFLQYLNIYLLKTENLFTILQNLLPNVVGLFIFINYLSIN